MFSAAAWDLDVPFLRTPLTVEDVANSTQKKQDSCDHQEGASPVTPSRLQRGGVYLLWDVFWETLGGLQNSQSIVLGRATRIGRDGGLGEGSGLG